MIKLKEIVSNKKFYRAIDKFIGNNVILEPNGYYESIDDMESPEFDSDGYVESDIPETAASKYIGGAILGAYSMYRVKGPYFIYEISDPPDKDISSWTSGDFKWLEEVRYRKDVKATYIGKALLDEKVLCLLEAFYDKISTDENEDLKNNKKNRCSKELHKLLDNNNFKKLLSGIKIR